MSFPKIFGGSNGNTRVYSIDVYNDYLAIAGLTSDLSLIPSTAVLSGPFVALMSISQSLKYYWAKALDKKSGYFYGV